MSRTKVTNKLLASAPAPLPTATVGVGEFKVINAAVGAALSLPAGGSWAWFGFYKNNTNNTVASISGGVSAGGTQLFAAVGDHQPYAMAYRVS